MRTKTEFNLDDLVRDNVTRLKPYSSARHEFKPRGQEMIYLDANENPYENGHNRYPDPLAGRLKDLLASRKQVQASNILFGNGSDEILDLVFRAFCEPKKDNVITLPPTYGMYKVLAEINDVEDREVRLDTDFEPQVDRIMDKVDTSTKILFLCSPNNPTGNTFSAEKVRKILTGFHGLVVIDEAYIDFSSGPSWLERLDEFPNLIITQTLSKAYGMAGIRLGICYASPKIIQVLTRIKPPYNINGLTQEKAFGAISDSGRVHSEITKIRSQREHMSTELGKLDFVKHVFPSDANFLLVKVDDATRRYGQILDRGIVLRNRSTQPLCEDTLRLTIGTESENRRLLRELMTINN